MCAEQAKKAFHEDIHPLKPKFVEWDYTSHYDPKENQCYVLTRYIDSDEIWFDVFDAFELREYASFSQHKGIVSDCEIRAKRHPIQFCKTQEEFHDEVEKRFGVDP